MVLPEKTEKFKTLTGKCDMQTKTSEIEYYRKSKRNHVNNASHLSIVLMFLDIKIMVHGWKLVLQLKSKNNLF